MLEVNTSTGHCLHQLQETPVPASYQDDMVLRGQHNWNKYFKETLETSEKVSVKSHLEKSQKSDLVRNIKERFNKCTDGKAVCFLDQSIL